ncbi:MAG: M4 family metallopeptidase [Gemmatimonadaceae bacterium]|nr:M4 family metallopeptidase [Gloeobacterales cyanobacterium ES-bin-141]
MLRSIIEHGNPRQRTWATQTLSLSERLRGRREILSRLVLATSTGQKRRTVYDARNGFELPGILIRTEGDPPSGDPAVDEAYDGAGATYDLYLDIFERNSLDDRGIRLDATVHYDRDYNNAFWDGRQMVYGDGDGQLFERFTRSIDVIAHELTHGVTQYEAGLVYSGQPGALNESFSDVFGSLVKQRVLNQTAAEADWLVGEGLFTANVQGVALRSLKAPGTAYDDPVLGKDPQPALLRDYQDVDYDNGGVHINSGIPNYAFYLTAVEIGGYAWEKAGRIWYIALKDRLRRDTNFERAATLILQVAGELYGEDGPEYRAVRNSWETVGIVI